MIAYFACANSRLQLSVCYTRWNAGSCTCFWRRAGVDGQNSAAHDRAVLVVDESSHRHNARVFVDVHTTDALAAGPSCLMSVWLVEVLVTGDELTPSMSSLFFAVPPLAVLLSSSLRSRLVLAGRCVAEDVVDQAVVSVVMVDGAHLRHVGPDEAVLYHVRAVWRHVEPRRVVIGV